MVPSQAQIQHLIQKLSGYYLLYQTCSDQVRPLGPTKIKVLHDNAYKKWQSDPTNPLFEPPRNDNHKKAQYFAKCDEICGMDAKTMEDYLTISFACWAGIQVITSQELDGYADRQKVWKAADDLAVKQYIARNPEVTAFPVSPDATDPELPSHLLSAIYPALAGSTTTRELGPHLIDQTVRYRDQGTGKIMELTIQDCGTSHLKGEWFEVMYDDLTVLQITARELKTILANRVD
ncbi:hypothetical protein JOM56_008281 [Amanita muscaria]